MSGSIASKMRELGFQKLLQGTSHIPGPACWIMRRWLVKGATLLRQAGQRGIEAKVTGLSRQAAECAGGLSGAHLCCSRLVEGEAAAAAQLEGVVELVLLRARLERHLVPPHHHEAAVA